MAFSSINLFFIIMKQEETVAVFICHCVLIVSNNKSIIGRTILTPPLVISSNKRKGGICRRAFRTKCSRVVVTAVAIVNKTLNEINKITTANYNNENNNTL